MMAIIQGNAGIDWGAFGGSNRAIIGDRVFHYGVIPACDVLQAWADSSTAIYPDFVCEHAQELFDDSTEVSEFVFDDSEYTASQAADDSDIFISRSAFFTFSAFCSPCAPGAGYLRDSRNAEDGIRVFCFSHDWFDNGIAPYGVWRVDNDALVIPDNPHAGMLQYAARADFAQRVAAWKEFNAAIVEYADKWGTKQESSAARAYVNTIESAFDAGGYDRVVACGTFEKMTWCE